MLLEYLAVTVLVPTLKSLKDEPSAKEPRWGCHLVLSITDPETQGKGRVLHSLMLKDTLVVHSAFNLNFVSFIWFCIYAFRSPVNSTVFLFQILIVHCRHIGKWLSFVLYSWTFRPLKKLVLLLVTMAKYYTKTKSRKKGSFWIQFKNTYHWVEKVLEEGVWGSLRQLVTQYLRLGSTWSHGIHRPEASCHVVSTDRKYLVLWHPPSGNRERWMHLCSSFSPSRSAQDPAKDPAKDPAHGEWYCLYLETPS